MVVTPPRSGSGVVNFQTRLPVLTSIALIEPWSCQPGRSCPKSPFSSPRKTLPWTSFCFFCGRRQLRLLQHRRGLGRRVEDVVRLRVVRRRREVEAAERGRVDRDRLARLQRRVLDAVDHLDPLVDRRARRGVVGEPDAFHRRHRDDPARLAADLARVDERRLRRVVGPLVRGHLLLPPLHLPGAEVDGDQRVGARVLARPELRVVERRRRAGAEVERVRRRVDRLRRPDDAAADDARELPPARPLRRDRPERVRPGRREVGVVGHHEAAHAVLRAGGAEHDVPFAQIGALVSE